jgi:peptidoglycan/xylan/chitin deacetylase (PgdA/CDA1 family)
MRQLLYRSLSQLQVPRALSWANRRKIVILMYHGFTDSPAHTGVENFQGLHLHVDMFQAHLEYLRNHFSIISLETLMDHYLHGRTLPPNPVVVTMDDGFRSNYTLAFPLLRKYQVPATIFLATAFVDEKRHQWADRVEYAVDHATPDALAALSAEYATDGNPGLSRGGSLVQLKARLKSIPQEQRAAIVEAIEDRLACSLLTAPEIPAIYQPLEWSEIEEMRGTGLVSFGNHTVSHFILSRCTPEVVREELSVAKRVIEERTGAPCPLFCYPNGARGDFDARTRDIVQEVGHMCALTTVAGFNDARSDVYGLKRVGVLNGQSFADFVMTVAGVVPWSMKVGDALRTAGIWN